MFWKDDRLSAGRDVFFFVWGQKFVTSLHLLRVIIELSLFFYGVGSQILDYIEIHLVI